MFGTRTQFKNEGHILGSNINIRQVVTEGKVEENGARL